MIFGCKKIIKNDKKYTVEGRLMYNCETPVSDIELSFSQGDPGIIGLKKPLFLIVKTDGEGYFKAVYNGKDANGSDFTIRKSGTIMEGIPIHQNIDLGNVYYDIPSFSFIVRLEVEQPYTDQDTLLYYDWNYPQNGAEHWGEKISGPFENSIIDTVWNCSYMSTITYGQDPNLSIGYFFNDFQANRKEANFPITNFCTDQLYEAVLKIE
jgi:hypothetical protein